MKFLGKILTILMCLAFVFAFVSCSNDELTDEDTEMTLKISFSNFTIAGGSATVTYGTSEKTGEATATVSADGKSAEATLLREYCNSDDKFTTVSYSVKDASGNAVELASSYATSFKFKKKSKSVTLKAKSSSSSTGEEPKTDGEQSDISNEKMTLTVKFYVYYKLTMEQSQMEESLYEFSEETSNVDENYWDKVVLTYGSVEKETTKAQSIVGEGNSKDVYFSEVQIVLDGAYASSSGIFDTIDMKIYKYDGASENEYDENAKYENARAISYPFKTITFNKNGAVFPVVYENSNFSNGEYKVDSGYSKEGNAIPFSNNGKSAEKVVEGGILSAYDKDETAKTYNAYRIAVTGGNLTDDDWICLSLDGSQDGENYFEFRKCYSASGVYFVLYFGQTDESAINAIAENGFYLYSSEMSGATVQCYRKVASWLEYHAG